MKVVANNPVVTSIAELLGKTPAQVALRWGIQQGQSVLPKSANESRLKENIGLFGWSIPDELCAKFSEVEQVKPFFSYLSEAQKMQYLTSIFTCSIWICASLHISAVSFNIVLQLNCRYYTGQLHI